MKAGKPIETSVEYHHGIRFVTRKRSTTNDKKAKPTCGYCLRGTEGLVKIECTPDGGRTWIYPILACAPCRKYLRGVYRIHKKKAEPKNHGVFADLEKWFSKKRRVGDRFIVTMMGSEVYEWNTEAGKK